MDDSQAAVKLQSSYRGFRHRRMLADAIIMKHWSRVVLFASQKSSTTFLNGSSNTRWTRISFNASLVGSGLCEDDEANILAFQHWTEAIDPRHRYGHSLRLYFTHWFTSNAGQPFFYWIEAVCCLITPQLDQGAGKKMDITECPRSKLREQCVKYLRPLERIQYEYIVAEERIIQSQSGDHLHTLGEKWIFVMCTRGRLYVGKKEKGRFHHSSFLVGGATTVAGSLVAEHGVLKSISANSGHYRPGEDTLDRFLSFLEENGGNLHGVQIEGVEPVIT